VFKERKSLKSKVFLLHLNVDSYVLVLCDNAWVESNLISVKLFIGRTEDVLVYHPMANYTINIWESHKLHKILAKLFKIHMAHQIIL
jgi:hypothetical protein